MSWGSRDAWDACRPHRCATDGCSCRARGRYRLRPLLNYAGTTPAVLAAKVGVHPRQIDRWAQIGLSERMADRCATRLGVHPATVWFLTWWAAA